MEKYEKDAVSFFQKAWLQEDVTELFEQVTDDFQFESPLTNTRGFEYFVKYVGSIKIAFSNIKLSFKNVYADEKSAVAYYNITADHTGVIMGLEPSGNKVNFDVFSYIEFEDTEIKYVRTVFDLFELKTQLEIR